VTPIKLSNASVNFDFPLIPAKLTPKGRITLSAFRTVGHNRPYIHAICQEIVHSWRAIRRIIGKDFESRLFFTTINNGMHALFVIPYDGQPGMTDFINKYRNKLGMAWNEDINAIVIASYNSWGMSRLHRWAKGQSTYGAKYNFTPPVNLSVNGTHSWPPITEGVLPPPKGFKMMPPALMTADEINVKEAMYRMRLALKKYKLEGVAP